MQSYCKHFFWIASINLISAREFFIIEIGGGTGCFAYRFLNELPDKLDKFESLRHLKLRYILTDFTESIVKKWLGNNKFEQYVRSGIFGFCCF